MKKLLLLLVLFAALAACNYSKYRYGFFEGNWVCLNYLDTVQKYRSVYKANHMQMQEIFLKRYADTLYLLTDGTQQQQIPFEHLTSNHIKSLNAKDSTSFFINEYAYYLSYDKNNTRYVFVKPDELLIDSFTDIAWPTSTHRVINSLVLGGIYRQEGNNVPLQFYTYGLISGTPLFNNYKVCFEQEYKNKYNGDMVYLSNQNSGAYYTWEWRKKELLIYSLTETTLPNATTVFKKDKLILSLTKLK